MASNILHRWKTDPEYIEVMNFLIERTKDSKSPLNVHRMVEEFKEKSGSSQTISCLFYRIRRLRSKIHEIDSIDTETKVKMIFALSAPIDNGFLKKLQMDAHVDVDKGNRITKYIANDGSLELEGDRNRSAKYKEIGKKRKRGSQEDSDDEFQDSDDESQNSILKTPGSVKRLAPEVPNSSKRSRTSPPNHSVRIRESRSRIQQLRRPKSENHAPDDSARIPELPKTPGIESPRQPKAEEVSEAPIFRKCGAPREKPIKTEPPGEDDAYTPQIEFIETMKFLIFPLDTPSLSQLQAKIVKKLRDSPDAKIPKNEVILAMELLVTKITNHSVPNLSGDVESVSLKEFLCYLKAAIMNSKLEGLEDLLQKIKEKINELTVKDRKIPVEKVESALQTTLDVIGF